MSNSITKQLAERWADEDENRDFVTAGAVSFEHYREKFTAAPTNIEITKSEVVEVSKTPVIKRRAGKPVQI